MEARRWIVVFGFWWSVAVLVYSTRTVQQLAAPLWAGVGVDAVGQAVIPVAFFFGVHMISLFARPERTTFLLFVAFFAYFVVTVLVGLAFAADHHQISLHEFSLDPDRVVSPTIGMMIGTGAGMLVGLTPFVIARARELEDARGG